MNPVTELSTGVLTDVLLQMQPRELEHYRKTYLSPIADMTFPEYYLSILSEHSLSRSTAAAGSGLEVHYAYQIMSGTRRPGRDKVICLCIGGRFSILETNRALTRAYFAPLYPKRLRDAVIMLAVSRGFSSVWQVNELLAEHGLDLLT